MVAEKFLTKVARRILSEHPTDADRTLVVFNNNRSQLFMRRAFEHLSIIEGKTFFLPQMAVIDEVVANLSGLKIVPNEFLLFELYRLHEEIGGAERKYSTFDEFMSFGEVMLADFSEIDRYCVDAKDLFVNLHGLKTIEEWDIENPEMSPFQRQYLDFYHSLFDYYDRLRKTLFARGEAYGGMAYRNVAENIATLSDKFNYQMVYFVGFNALSECERRIIGTLCRQGKGTLLTDSDTYYFDDKKQEAGLFLRLHCKEFPTLRPEGESLFATVKKKITIVECPEAVIQCKYAGQILEADNDWIDDSESTAIVLADESLILPTLASLPEMGKSYGVNISMGFSYADSMVHQTVCRVLDLFRQARHDGYYHTTVVELLSDYHIAHLLHRSDLRVRAIRYIERENRIRCGSSELQHIVGSSILNFLMPDTPPTVNDALNCLRHLAETMLAEHTVDGDKKELQALGGMTEIVDYLTQLQNEYGYIGELSTLSRIYDRIAQRHQISFIGQPLSGLQILGVLETRNLDFKRVILLSAGEGVIPSSGRQNTLIPYELQRVFHLPTYEEKDAVFAYNFYRLLQRAEEVYLCFSTEAGNMGKKGEESRFLKQVRDELSAKMPQSITVTDVVVVADSTLKQATPIQPVGLKSDDVMSRLQRLAERGFSPSSLNNYIECPLRYYYVNVLGIDEPEAIEEDLDASQMGTCVHNVLQEIFTPYVGREVESAGLRRALSEVPEQLQHAFSDLYSHGRNTEGRNHFLYSVAESQVRHMLRHEIATIEGGHHIEMVALEQELRLPLGEQVMLKGFVDRIDRFDGMLRVVDYKTGSLKPDEIELSSENLDAGIIPGKWMQLMCYALLYRRTSPNAEPTMQVGIYPLRHLNSGVQLASWDKSTRLTDPMLDIFEHRLRAIVNEILDPNIPFDPGVKPRGCNFCPVKRFCEAAL